MLSIKDNKSRKLEKALEENLRRELNEEIENEDGTTSEKIEWITVSDYSNVSSDVDSRKEFGTSMAKVFGGFGTTLYAYGFDFSIAFDPFNYYLIHIIPVFSQFTE